MLPKVHRYDKPTHGYLLISLWEYMERYHQIASIILAGLVRERLRRPLNKDGIAMMISESS